MDSKVMEAVQANDLDALNTLLNDPSTDVTQRDPEGRGLLHLAVLAQAGAKFLKALADRVDLALRDQQGNTALELIPEGDAGSGLREVLEEKVKELILSGGEVGEKEAQRLVLAGWSHWPVTAEESQQKSEEAVRIRDKVMELKTKAEGVHKAVQEKRLDDLKQLLSEESSLLVTSADRTGLLPLHKAVLCGHTELVNYLTATFADTINSADNMGRTALHYAAALSVSETEGKGLYDALKDAGADDTIKDLTGKTPEDSQHEPVTIPIKDLRNMLIQETTQTAADDNTTTTTAEGGATTQQSEQDISPSGEQQQQQQQQSVVEEKVKTPSPPPPKEPAKPAVVTPVKMYVAGAERDRAPPPSTVDGKYVAQHLGSALTMALAEIAEKRPWDPIEYLGLWLYKYRKNLDELDHQRALLSEIRDEEKAANEEEVVKFKRKEEELKIREEERIQREEEEAARKKREQEELQRQAKEAMLAQKPQLPTVREEEIEDNMVRERDSQGQTELHVLAAQSGADLVAVMNLGYSLADRDLNNKTARDIAEDQGITENIETIDNYVTNLLEQEKLDTLRQLVVEGYDKLDAVLSKVSTEGLPSSVTDFVNSIPALQERVSSVFMAVSEGAASEVSETLEDKTLALAKDACGRNPLHLALLAGHMDIAKDIVANFPLSLKSRDNLNRTPLHYAAALSEEMTDLLKASGADTNAKDAMQHIPSFYKDEKEQILQLKSALASSATETPADLSVPVPQITADDIPSDGNETKEEGAHQDENKEENKEDKQSVAATITTQEEPSD